MADILKSLTKDKKPDTIFDEIRARVLEKYAENKGFESQENELKATLEALHEMTNLPMDEIEKIAAKVQDEHSAPAKPVEEIPIGDLHVPQQSTDLYFDQMTQSLEKGKRGFVYQLIPYLTINSVLVFLNIYSSSFPWALFPIAFWGIGLISHYMGAVHWPSKSLQNQLKTLQSQIHQILIENSSYYRSRSDSNYYNGVYRLTVTHCSQEILEEYLLNADRSISQNEIKQISSQVKSLQQEYVQGKRQQIPDWQQEVRKAKQMGRKYKRHNCR